MLNVITLHGRLVDDPSSRRTPGGVSVASFRIANDDGKKDANGKKVNVLYLDCSAFGPQADFVTKYFRKGTPIGVTGRLATRTYVNKQQVTVTTYQIICDRIDFVDTGSGAKKEGGEMPTRPGVSDDAGYMPQTSPVSESSGTETFDSFNTDTLPF